MFPFAGRIRVSSNGRGIAPLIDSHPEPFPRNEIREIAQRLLDISGPQDHPGIEGTLDDESLADLARSLYRMRRRRDTWFAGSLFGDPTWDILLDLFSNTVLGRKVSVTSACRACIKPVSTGLRWLQALEREGLIRRTRDEDDQRVMIVTMTDAGMAAMRQCLSEAYRGLR